MGPSFSLEYYDRIFGARTPAYQELLFALSAELEDYAANLGPILDSGDASALSRLRHAHRPLVQNLNLTGLQALEAEIRQAVDAGALRAQLADQEARFVHEARVVARLLTLPVP